MKRFEGMILCSDVDGTLIDENNQVPKENLEAIEYFQAHGGKFALATGRVPEALFPILPGLDPDFPCICHNGCSIYDMKTRTYIDTVELDRSSEKVIREIQRISPSSGIEIMTTEGICIVKRNHATDRHITFEKISAMQASSLEEVKAPWLKTLFANEPEEISVIQNAMEHSPYHADYTIIRTHQYYYEIFHKEASKGNALRQLCKLFAIRPEDVIAIGDNDNDVSMLQAVGKSAAVQNASESAKAHADIVTTRTNAQGAVAELISKL